MAVRRYSYGRKLDVEVKIYGECKYTAEPKLEGKVQYKNVESWEVINGLEAYALELEMDGECVDDCQEYLVIHMEGGKTATFRNSYVDMFAI